MKGLKIRTGSYNATVVTRGQFSTTTVSLGDTILNISETDQGFQVNVSNVPTKQAGKITVPAVDIDMVDIDQDDIKSNRVSTGTPGLLRTCAVCNGQSYCVTNGCVNIGCGWLCD